MVDTLISREQAERLLQDSATEARTLMALIGQFRHDVSVAEAVARHPACPEPQLIHFLTLLPEAAAQNPRLPELQKDPRFLDRCTRNAPRTLENKSPYWEPNYAYSYHVNPERPERYKVDYWLKHGSIADQRIVLAIEALPLEIVEPFLASKSAPIRKQLAGRASLPEGGFARLAADAAKTVRRAVAENPKAPAEVLARLALDAEPGVAQAARENPACPQAARQQAALQEAAQPALGDKPVSALQPAELRQLISDPATGTAALAELAAHPQAWVRGAVALHPNADGETLTVLAAAAEPWVGDCVAFNPRTPEPVLQTLFAPSSPGRLLALASNPALPVALQKQIAQLGDANVKRVLADTTEAEDVWQAILANTPAAEKHKWRDQLAKALDPNVKGATLTGLQRGAESRYLFLSKIAARHPLCPKWLKPVYAYYLFDQLAQNPAVALQLLEDPQAISPKPYKDWKVDQWLSDGVAPAKVANYYLRSEDAGRKRKAANCWAAAVSLVQPLVFDEDIHLQKRLAQREGNTHFMFEVLARSDKPSVRELVAKNPQCPASVLQLLAQDKAAAVRAAVLQQPGFKPAATAEPVALADKGPKPKRIKMAREAKDVAVLADLAGDRAEEVRAEVALNEHACAELLARLAADESAKVRQAVAWHSDTPEATVARLLDDADDEVRATALRHRCWLERRLEDPGPDYDKPRHHREEVLARFYDDPASRVRRVVAGFTKSPEVQLKYLDEGEKELLRALAHNPFLCEAAARRIAQNPDGWLRRLMARSLQLREVLLDLLDDPDDGVAENALSKLGVHTDPHLRRELHQHPNPAVRRTVAYTLEHEPEAVFLNLAGDDTREVLLALAHNQHLPPKARSALVERANREVIGALLSSTALTQPEREALCEHPNPAVRAAVAREVLDQALIERLSWDPDPAVRAGVLRNYSTPSEVSARVKDDPAVQAALERSS